MDKELSDLRRQGKKLRPGLHVGRAGISDAVVQQIRQLLRNNNLIKVRVTAADREAVAQAVQTLAERVPCRVVERMGFVAVLYSTEFAGAAASRNSEQSEVQ